MEKSLKELAEYLGGRVIGDENATVTGIAAIDKAGVNDVTFLANPKYAGKLAASKAGAVILPSGADRCGKHGIEVGNPHLAFAKMLDLFHARQPKPKGVMAGAIIGSDVVIGKDVTVYPGAYVGDGVRIGDRVTIHPSAVVYENAELGNDVVIHANVSIREGCRIGNRVTIHCGAVIGGDGFGYAPNGNEWYKIQQLGIVIIEDDVEIGANTTIDRAALDVTRIGRGTKIDNQVQLAHNCVLGENCMIAAQVGIAGSTRLGNHVILAGQVGVAGHIQIGDNVMAGGKTGITSGLPAGAIVNGWPAFSHRDWLRVSAIIPKLPELRKLVSSLEKKVADIEERLAERE